jgi:hypothetical protein
MADGENKPAIADEPYGSGANQPAGGRNWVPMVTGAVLVLIAVTLVVVLTRNKPASTRPDPYIAKLQISNLHMETAENFAGGSVTYVEGTLENTGDKKVTGAQVQAIFKNSLNERVGAPVLPVMILQPNTPIVDYGPMEHAPLGPGQKRDFRITLEHISADWDGRLPQVQVVAVSSS